MENIHILTVDDRKRANVTSVSEVLSFSEKEVKLEIYTIDNKEEAYYAFVADESRISINITKGKEKYVCY